MAKDKFFEKYKDPRWQKKRLEVMTRADWACEACGESANQLQVHHGYYRKGADPWDYEMDTLWCLCDECHEMAKNDRASINKELARINPEDARVVGSVIRDLRILSIGRKRNG